MSSNGSPTYELQQMPGVALSVNNRRPKRIQRATLKLRLISIQVDP